jgi:hypothetical protein
MELQSRKFARMELEGPIQKKLESLKKALPGAFFLHNISEIDFHLVADLAIDLRNLKEKWDVITAEIKKIEEELRG